MGVTADNSRHGRPAGRDTILVERVGYVGHMPMQASLRDQRTGENTRRNQPERNTQQLTLDADSDGSHHDEENEECDHTGGAALIRSVRIAIEFFVEPADQCADPDDRMCDRTHQLLRIAEAELDQHGNEGKRDRHDPHRRCG